MSVTTDELLDALAAAHRGTAPEDARTVQELVHETGWTARRVRVALHTLNAVGRLVVHSTTRPALDGRAAAVPAYTILPAP